MGRAVRDQRLHVGWTQQEAAERAGVSLATWRLIESGGRDRYQELTVRGVTRCLGWPADAFDRILDGEPAPPLGAVAAHAPATSPTSRTAPGDAELPAGFAQKYLELTPEEQAMVHGYVDGLAERRTAG